MARGAQLALGFDHRPSLGGDDFLVASCNRDAVAWLDRWPDWGAPALIIFGPPGCGKTHLAHVFAERSGGALVKGEALGAGDPSSLLGSVQACIVDDADHGVGDGDGERSLLHLYNAVAEAGAHLLMTAGAAPREWQLSLADLRSRLLAAPAVGIRMPDDELIKAVLAKQFSDRQLRVEPEILDYLTTRMERSLDTARRLVHAIDEAALASRRDITLPLARQVLRTLDG